MAEKRHIFDDRLNSSLSGLDGNVNPQDWERIASALDQIDASNNVFDESLKESTAGLEHEVPESAWTYVVNALTNKRRRAVAFWWSLAALLLLTTGLWIADSYYNKVTPDSPTAVESQEDQDLTIEDKTEGLTEPENAKDNASSDANTGNNTSEVEGNQEVKIEDVPSERKYVESQDFRSHQDETQNIDTEQEDIMSNRGNPIAEGEQQLTTQEFTAERLGLKQPVIDVILEDVQLGGLVVTGTKLSEIPRNLQSLANVTPTWEFGLRATPNISALKSVANKAEAWRIHKDYFDIAKNSETSTTGYTFGVNALYYVGKRFYVASGIYYSQKVERVDYDYVIDELVSVNYPEKSLGYHGMFPGLHQKVKYDGINTFSFVEIPLKFGTIVSLGPVSKWELRAETGLSCMALLQSSGKKPDQTYLELYDLSSYPELKKAAMGMEVKGGIYYKGIRHFRFGVEPSFGMSITSLYSKNAPTKLRPYNYGLNVTANYILFKK